MGNKKIKNVAPLDRKLQPRVKPKKDKVPKVVAKPTPPVKTNEPFRGVAPPSRPKKNNNVTTTFSYGGFSSGELYGMSDKQILKKHFPNISRDKYFPKDKKPKPK